MQPFLKWPGGKRRVLPSLRPFFPSSYGTYREGFIGGGAVLLNLSPERASAYDVNVELIKTYQAVRDELDTVVDLLEGHKSQHSKEHFLEVRARDREDGYLDSASDAEVAARMIYLNRTCFNGLYRVNRKNQFNAPMGDYKNPRILDREGLEEVSAYLSENDVTFSDQGYLHCVAQTEPGDFVYLDPPYIPASATASFVSYAKTGFTMDDQIELAKRARDMDADGAYVLLSNSDTDLTRELYDGFILVPIDVTRSISAANASRVKAGELIIVGPRLAETIQEEKKNA